MKTILLLLATMSLTVAAEAADPPKTSCIDPHRDYVARALTNHEVYVENSMGAKKPPLRVTTSCFHLERSSGFGFSKEYSCIGQGDGVVASTFSEVQSCRVTKIAPYVPQPGDMKP